MDKIKLWRRTESTSLQLSPLWAICIVFLSNFCILVIEIVAGRLMAPIVGVSLYTWTSIIGVILAGISLGNYLGGKIADRWASRITLAWLFVLSALTSSSILAAINWIDPLRNLNMPIFVSIVLIFAAVFLLPSTVLGTISPIVVKLTLVDLSQTGDVVGKIYAAAAVGSIGGTFATGFILISAFGTRQLVWGVALGLLLIGAIIGLGARTRRRYAPAILLLIFMAISVIVQRQGWLDSRCYLETNYFCIKVRIDNDNPDIRILTLDRLVHSYVDLSDPTNLRYQYERIYGGVVEYAFVDRPPESALFIGGGGYTFPYYLEVTYPESRIDVIEIDPGVTETAHAVLGLPRDTTIRSINEDARWAISEMPPSQQYDLIIGDAFNDFSVPYHLTTLEFNHLVADHLTEQGIYMVNIVDGKQGDFFRAYTHTLQQVFDHVQVAAVGGIIGDRIRQTYVILASQQPLDEITTAASLDDYFVSTAELQRYLNQGQTVLLTDDYVPVDNLLAPVFADSGL
jgi:spermidine synthase